MRPCVSQAVFKLILMRIKKRIADFGIKRILIVGCLCLFSLACAGPSVKTVKPEPAKGVYHLVKKGETLWSISRAYRANLQELAELNNITDASAIETGTVIFIPGAEKTIDTIVVPASEEPSAKKTPSSPPPVVQAPVKKPQRPDTGPAGAVKPAKQTSEPTGKKPVAKKQDEEVKTTQAEKPPEPDRIEFDKNRFAWPVKGTILARYGVQPNGSKNNGIKIAAQENTPVLAAAAGEVTYSDSLKYYGDTVIIRHDDNFSTVYSSLKGRLVKVGDHVKKGEKIALLAKPDSNGQACLNFEIRQINKPRNPLFFLP